MVLFPGGKLALKIFEVRYLDMITASLRAGTPFGVVRLVEGSEVRQAGVTEGFEQVGTLAHLDEVDAETTGILQVACTGGSRFEWRQARHLRAADPVVPPGERLATATEALAQAMELVDSRDPGRLPSERHLDDAGWVANRWCELLRMTPTRKQLLMAQQNPVLRLALVQDVLAFASQGFAAFAQRFARLDALQGQAVQLSDGTRGTACGVNDDGALQRGSERAPMLRWAITLLLLANLGYFAWTQGHLDGLGMAPADPREPQRMTGQVKPEVLRLLNGPKGTGDPDIPVPPATDAPPALAEQASA
eukprot:gene41165-54535_t